jgi:hypothetical protein
MSLHGLSMVRPVALLIALVLFTSGCALLYTFDDQLEQRIDTWIQQQEYGKALATLEYVRPTHAKYDRLLKKKQQILTLSKSLADDTVRRSQQHMKVYQWQEADNLYQQGLEKMPHNPQLESAYQEFNKQRDHYLTTLHYQLFIYKAQWLNKNTRIQHDLAHATPNDSSATRALKQHDEEVQTVYQELLHCGMDSINQNELELAEQCLLLAEQLQPGGKSQTALSQVQEQLALLEKRKTNITPRQTEELLELSKQAMGKNNLKQSQKLFNQIPAKDHSLTPIKQFKKSLDERIANNVSQGIEMGRKLYSQGEVENALAVWNDLRELDPDNEQLDSHIERANRVLNKLKTLKKTEPVVAPPSANKSKS